MRKLLMIAALLISAMPAMAERIVPMCPEPRGGLVISLGIAFGEMSESEQAAFFEQRLRARGIDATDTRFWNGCIQTFVRENGTFSLQFFDPETLERIELER